MKEILREAPHPFKGTEIHTLSNGLTLILKQDNTVPVVALQAWARCGAIDESPDIYGISHGLEHMVFKGTPTRSAGEITKHVEGAGGSMNAATQLETTHYYIDIPSYGLDTALDVLADTLLHPTFPQEELERERLVILEEIHRRDDSPDATLWDEFSSQLFHGTPYGIKVIGTKETVSALSRENLFSYFHKHYVPSNLSVVIAGDIRKDKVLKKCRSLFEKLSPLKAPEKPIVNISQNGKPSTSKLKKPVQLSYFAMGIPTVGIGHPDGIPLDVLADVLVGGASSRLYQRLREEKQIVLSLACEAISFEQQGIFAFFGETFPDKAFTALHHIKQEILNLEKDPLLPAELNRAKARIKSEWLHGSETPHGQASTLGTLSVHKQLALINNYLNRIEALTVDDLTDVARRYLWADGYHTTILEPES